MIYFALTYIVATLTNPTKNCLLSMFNVCGISAMNEDLKACVPVSKLGWLDPQEIRDERCYGSQPDVKLYLETGIRACEQRKCKLIFAPYLQS